MLPIRTVVCGIDFSDDSRRALRTAIAMAQQRPIHIVAVHVIEHAALSGGLTRDDERANNETATALRFFVESECKLGSAAARYSIDVRAGVPERELLACAARYNADLIAVGTRGISGTEKLFFGSVAEKILRRAELPVLAVPSPADDEAPVLLTRVMAAIDLDDSAAGTAAKAADIAHLLHLPLCLVHAVVPAPAAWRWIDSLEGSTPFRMRRARRRLGEIAQTLEIAADLDVRIGPPATAVAEAARQREGTLVIVGLDSGRPLMRLGSTAYRIICASDVPVLAVPVHAVAAAVLQQDALGAGQPL